ncbi:hypothetical protein A3D08_00520 [Candidatus Roizmanbacteria bacterium RIFCSPHIGHO2_02_FULL_43_11]|uniref:Uncharacterized protein n=1 Tax=Candidatus Roizmanbacteria bacterium RIFCSPHIGHO2_02_FULL_43_11 TaxID=1802043 RepID=A0A1F7HKG0_9BACT|nr:MAG: hypothetical protein A3D08_00520 [Candidatus Roizmanbacteria bacterium RIFCSPHIGHO2_02_FULL_43_11]
MVMNMDALKNKNVVITGVVIIALIASGVLLTQLNKDGSETKVKRDQTILPEIEAIPTVDASVKVELKQVVPMKEVNLIVTNVPEGTESIDYSITYDAEVDGEIVPKGAIGSLDVDTKKWTAKNSRVIILGTESSGAKKYDKVVGAATVELKFQGSYGAKLYKGEFEL